MAGYYQRQSSRRRKILELALSDADSYSKKRFREIFALLQKHGASVLGYRTRLEDALKYVDKAVTAINAIES